MKDFIFQSTPRVIFGVKSIDFLIEELATLKGKTALIVCDPVIEKTNWFSCILKKLEDSGIKKSVFSDIVSDPGFETVDAARDCAIAAKSDIVIGIGGGSAMDVAKVVAITAKTGEGARELSQKGKICDAGLPLILIPTTAGTGSEVTHISIFSDNEEKLKTGLVSPYLYADVAILDPEITLGLPKTVTAFSGVDAIIHALEALTSNRATPLTDLLALEALEILYKNIGKAYDYGKNIEARSNMLYGSMLAGKAFANSGVAAVHAFSYPIGAEYHIPHGLANSIMLIPVLKFNLQANKEKYWLAAKAIGIETKGFTETEVLNRLVASLDTLLNRLKIKRGLANYGVTEANIPDLASAVMKVTRLLSNNPREVSISDAENLYREAL